MRICTIIIFLAILTGNGKKLQAQQTMLDALFAGRDSTIVMDSLLKDLDDLLSNSQKSKSYAMVTAGLGSGFFNFRNGNNFLLQSKQTMVFSPAVMYSHQSGWGLMVNGYFLLENNKWQWYQLALSPSYDYIKPKIFSTGIAYTFYKTRKEVDFYTSPLQHEMYAYFSYKKWLIQPAIAVVYGWGSKMEYEQKLLQILSQRYRQAGRRSAIVNVENEETINDFSILLSVRHHFYWYQLFHSKDHLALTPAILLNAGTQKFGFNTAYSSNSALITRNFLPGNQYISDQYQFSPQSSTFIFRLEYGLGKVFIQPQVMLDYYLHDADQRWNTVFSIIGGITF